MRINTDKKIKNNKKGVTLIEILIVMLIVTALFAVLVFNFSAATDKAKEAKALSDFRTAKINARIDLLDGHMDTVRFADLVAQLQEVVATAIKSISKPNKTQKLF